MDNYRMKCECGNQPLIPFQKKEEDDRGLTIKSIQHYNGQCECGRWYHIEVINSIVITRDYDKEKDLGLNARVKEGKSYEFNQNSNQ